MGLVVPNSAEQDMLEIYLGKRPQEGVVLKLFSNDVTPSDTDTSATFTEPSGNGYAAQPIIAANWTVTPGAPAVALHPEMTFTFTGAAGNVYGYTIEGATTGDLKWSERFTDGPYNVANVGDQIKVTPRITLTGGAV